MNIWMNERMNEGGETIHNMYKYVGYVKTENYVETQKATHCNTKRNFGIYQENIQSL